jgi:uncharacterized protein (DUF58 family)
MLLGSLHLTRFTFLLLSGVAVVIGLSYLFPWLMLVGKTLLIVVFLAVIADVMLVYLSKEPITAKRIFQDRMNLGDPNEIELKILNRTVQPLNVMIYEGYPVAMQKRSSAVSMLLLPRKSRSIKYVYTPAERGEYQFRDVVVFVRSAFFLAQRRIIIPAEDVFHVYPSVLQMKQFELKVFNKQTISQGIKKIRRIGNTSEFEQIRNYVQGDDIRTINWKATSRKSELMVNQFQEERSQPVYCIVDKSRPMQLAFHDMSMLDYAINSSLVFSNIALRKGDRAGLITYSDKIGSIIPADKSAGQLRRILETLYNQRTHFREGNFELLYQTVRRTVRTRALLMLFTNFESEFAMRRALPMLQKLNKHHLLVVIFFQNNELGEWAQQPVASVKELIESTVAEKMMAVKWSIASELRKNGIQTILSRPEDLSVNAINKYLELKAKGGV